MTATGILGCAFSVIAAPNAVHPLVRQDYLIVGQPMIRMTRFVDSSRLSQGVLKSWNLFQVDEMRFVNIFDTDSRVEERSVELRGDGQKERLRFVRSVTRTGLTVAELAQRFGLLVTRSTEFKVSLEDATRRTVMRRLESVWEDWRPAARVGLRSVYQVLNDCGIPVSRGDILNLLFADVPRAACTVDFKAVPPDLAADRPFLLIAPELEGVLKSKTIVPGAPELVGPVPASPP